MIVIVNVQKRIRKMFLDGATNEEMYSAYRVLTGKGIQKSWAVVKPLLKKWGKK